MKTETLKSNPEKKAEIIKLFAEVIDKNTTSQHDVWCLIHVLQDACEFMNDKRYKYISDLPLSIRFMREKLRDGSEKILYDDITDDIQQAIMIAGANAEGLIVVNSSSMCEDLHDISDEFNS